MHSCQPANLVAAAQLMLGGTIHDTEASPPPTAHEVNDTERRASYNSSTRPYRAPHGPGTARARAARDALFSTHKCGRML